ncbi:MAG: pilus assembly protein [Rhizobiales bacterium]|nr:pilus assembly protein [Hyphomicrobiales bacterium]NRB14225.1 pilus assembly protein [Hyphomicrobiales bacterium]
MTLSHIFVKFLRCDKASSAIEFALVAPMFLAVVFSIFEVGYVFLTDLAMESSLANAARLIRTGQVSGTMNAAQFKTIICDNTFNLVNCDKINVEVDVFGDFESGTNLPSLFDDDGKLVNNQVFKAGSRDSIIVARTTYLYNIINPFGNVVQLSNYGDNQYLQVHVVAFKNEPF